MKKWEYCEVEVTIGGPISGTSVDIKMYKEDGKHTEYSEKFGKALAILGAKGWELAASSARIETGLSSKHKINYIFKRPIEE